MCLCVLVFYIIKFTRLEYIILMFQNMFPLRHNDVIKHIFTI